MLISIDPGPVESAICYYGERIQSAKVPNLQIVKILERHTTSPLAIEVMANLGMIVGESVFRTCEWIGVFLWVHGVNQAPQIRINRREVKMHICGSMRAKDPNVRAALISRFGPPGTKKCPGITYGITGDQWSALAIAVTAKETKLQNTLLASSLVKAETSNGQIP